LKNGVSKDVPILLFVGILTSVFYMYTLFVNSSMFTVCLGLG